MKIPLVYRYRYMHNGDYAHNGCFGVAFYYKDKMQGNDTLKVEKALLVNGEKPVPNTPAVCGSCGGRIELSNRFLSIEDRVNGQV